MKIKDLKNLTDLKYYPMWLQIVMLVVTKYHLARCKNYTPIITILTITIQQQIIKSAAVVNFNILKEKRK